jgi:glyoxylase-like metal-dependent hydrolase (beta-lactamase superfamily II)
MRNIKMWLATAVLLTSVGLNLRAQDDAQAVVSGAAQALGTANLMTIEYSGTGTIATFGQNWKHDVQWPEFKLTSYTVDIDYRTPAMRVDLTRDNPENGLPMQGGGYPLLAPQRVNQAVSGKFAWNSFGQNTVADLASVNDRTLEIWSTPQGVIKAAQAAGANVKTQIVKNSKGEITGTILTFPVGNTTFKATVTKDNLISRVEYTTDTAMLGDTTTTLLYSGYQDYGGVKFPAKMARLQGGVRSVNMDSYPTLTLAVNKVMPNATVAIDVPQNVQQAAAAPPAAIVPVVDKITDGVYLVSGQGPNSVAVEFSDHIAVVEAPVGDALVMARFDAIRKTIPNKPIRYVISTHHHFDHAGGVRAAVAEGAILVVPGWSRVFYDRVMLAPHTLNPDLQAKSPKEPMIEDVGTAFGTERDMREFTDGKRTLRVYRVLGSQEADAMLILYLPNEKMLIEADMFTPSTPNPDAVPAAPAGGAGGRGREAPLILTPEPLVLYNNIKRLKIDVETIVPLHGRPVKMAELLSTIGEN